MINRNVLPMSMYYSIYGLVYEVDFPEKRELSIPAMKDNAACFADWVADYTGYVYKCRDPEGKELKKYLLSDRKSFKKFKTSKELSEFLEPIHQIVHAYHEWEIKRYK